MKSESVPPSVHKSRNEWRLDDKQQLDDVVVENVATFRLERMSHVHVWGAVYMRDGSRTVFNIYGNRGARVMLSHEQDQAASPAQPYAAQPRTKQGVEMVTEIEFKNGKDENIEVTLRGKPEHVIKALVSGMPREALEQFGEALAEELKKRHE